MKNIVELLHMLEIVGIFAVLQDDNCICYAEQAVNLLNYLLGIFCVQDFAGDINVGSKNHIRYWRLPIRKIHICSRSEYNHLVAAYMATAFFVAISKPF